VTATIQVGEYPYAIAVDPIHYMVWVTDYLGASVSAIDERTNIVVATLPVGTLPHDITVDPFQGTVYVANDGGRNVAVIDEATLTVTTTVAVPNNLPTVGIGVDPIRGLVGVTTFTSGFLKSYLNVLDENTDQFINTITLGSGGSDSNDVGRLVVDPVRGFVYLPQYFAGTLQVLDEKTATITKTIVSTTLTNPGDGGPGTNGIALDPFTGTVYVANINVGTVSVIDPVKGYVKATVTIPNASDELSGTAVDPILGLAYVANYNNNTISVISTGKGTSCEEIKDYPLLPLYCKTDLLKVKDRY
jgi:YVTN family beta-propeller protein